MLEAQKTYSKRLLVVLAALLAAALLCCGLLGAHKAQASELDDLQEQVSQYAKAYEDAVAKSESLAADIEAKEQEIKAMEEQLGERQEEYGQALLSMYLGINNRSSVVSAVLGAGSFKDALKFLDSYSFIVKHNNALLDEANELCSELKDAQSSLEEQKAQADAAVQEASEALAQAEEARDAAMDKAATEAEKATTGTTGGSSSSSSGASTVDTSSMSSDKASFVNSWASRIDAYFEGTPLYGYGATFAAAAYDYNVDPRFSPAISCVESSKGLYCFREHNAWGWGSCSWSTWEEAIYAHTYGLASIYGYTVTLEGAYMYCPPSAEHWYSRVSEEMAKI